MQALLAITHATIPVMYDQWDMYGPALDLLRLRVLSLEVPALVDDMKCMSLQERSGGFRVLGRCCEVKMFDPYADE